MRWEKSQSDIEPAISRIQYLLNSLPNDKMLVQSKLKAFADDNLNVYQILKYALGRAEGIVGKGENAGYQHFLLFPQRFHKSSS